MSYSNGIISAPVSIDDVKAALGESSNDLSVLCTSKNINMWSKHKPTRWAVPFYETADQIIKSQWWNGVDNNFNIRYASFVTNAVNVRDGQQQQVSYVKPNGGSVSDGYPYRLGDFKDYHGTPSWLESGGLNKLVETGIDVSNTALNGHIYVTFRPSYVVSEHTLNFFEVASIPNNSAFFGVQFAILIGKGATGADEDGYIYRTITTEIPFSQITTSNKELKKTIGNTSYTIAKYSRPIESALTLDIKMLPSLWQQYIGKSVVMMCIVSNAPYNWDSGNGVGVCKVLTIQGENIGGAYNNGSASFSVKSASEDANYKRPSAVVNLQNVYYNTANGSITIGGIALTLTNKYAQGSGYTTYWVTTVEIAVLRWNSSGQLYVYDNSKSVTINESMTLNYVLGSSTTKQIANADMYVPVKTTSSKYKVMISVNIKSYASQDSFSAQIQKEI